MQDSFKYVSRSSRPITVFKYFFLFLLVFTLSVAGSSEWDRPVFCSGGVCGNIEVSNINITDSATFNGQIFFENESRVKRELIFKATNAVKGAFAPTDTARDIGASGDIKVGVISFSKTTQQDIYGSFHPPSDIDNSEDIGVHLMWMPGEDYTGGNYMWKLEYFVKGEFDPTDTGVPTTISLNITPTNGTEMRESKFNESIDLNNEEIVYIHFYRDVANDEADDIGEVIFFEAEYVVNKLGTQLDVID